MTDPCSYDDHDEEFQSAQSPQSGGSQGSSGSPADDPYSYDDRHEDDFQEDNSGGDQDNDALQRQSSQDPDSNPSSPADEGFDDQDDNAYQNDEGNALQDQVEPSYMTGQSDDQDAATVGSGDYIVKRGDDMSKIATAHGFFWQTLWNLPENSQLKNERKNPNQLLEGDKVFIPELRRKDESCGDQEKHRFRRKGVPSKLRVALYRSGQPRVGVEWEFTAAGNTYSGTTGSDGIVETFVPPEASSGTLVLKEGETIETRSMSIGVLDPVESVRGVQYRLKNLGYDCGFSGEIDDKTTEAIKQFQSANELDTTGKNDQDFRDKLQEIHGS